MKCVKNVKLKGNMTCEQNIFILSHIKAVISLNKNKNILFN